MDSAIATPTQLLQGLTTDVLLLVCQLVQLAIAYETACWAPEVPDPLFTAPPVQNPVPATQQPPPSNSKIRTRPRDRSKWLTLPPLLELALTIHQRNTLEPVFLPSSHHPVRLSRCPCPAISTRSHLYLRLQPRHSCYRPSISYARATAYPLDCTRRRLWLARPCDRVQKTGWDRFRGDCSADEDEGCETAGRGWEDARGYACPCPCPRRNVSRRLDDFENEAGCVFEMVKMASTGRTHRRTTAYFFLCIYLLKDTKCVNVLSVYQC
jgi:hypothetical protein